MYTMQQGTLRDLLFKAARLLAGFHPQPVVDSLLQTELPSERYVRSPLAPLWPNSNPRLACGRQIQGSSRSHSSPRSLGSARSCARASGEAGIVCPLLARRAFGLWGGHQGCQRTGLTGERLVACRDMVQLWRSLGSSDLGPQVLRHLAERLDKAPETRPLCNDADQEPHRLKVCSSAEAFLQLPTCFLT